MGTLIRAAKASEKRFVGNVRFENDRMVIAFVDGNELPVPLAWFPKLYYATPRQRSGWRVANHGQHIHWPELNEEVSLDSLIQ